MPTIITAHMANTNANSMARRGMKLLRFATAYGTDADLSSTSALRSPARARTSRAAATKRAARADCEHDLAASRHHHEQTLPTSNRSPLSGFVYSDVSAGCVPKSLSAGRFGRLNVFRPNAEAEQPAGNAAQYRPLH